MSDKRTGIERIADERQRQITTEGWTPAHDDEHVKGEMAIAASCYADLACVQSRLPSAASDCPSHPNWPWGPEWWKPSDDPIRNLEKAGALMAAEIDRLQRIRRSAETPLPSA